MIQWILVCFGCCYSPKKVENIEKAKTSQVSAQIANPSNDIKSKAGERQLTILVIDEDKFYDLKTIPVQNEGNPIDTSLSEQIDNKESPCDFSILKLLKEKSLSDIQLMRGISNDHLHGTVTELNLEDGTYKGKYDNGEIVTGTIDSLNCCFYTINKQNE